MPLPGAAERAVLVQLLLSPGRTIPATMLVDRLWSDSSLPLDPMNALQVRVSKLRRSMQHVGLPGLVTREGVGYRANVDPAAVDAVMFADLVGKARSAASVAAGTFDPSHLAAYDAALALWRGDPLSDFLTEPWAAAEAARFTELRFGALTERAQIALGLGRHLEVVGDLEPMVTRDPTLESLAGLLMVALYRSGRQADALEVYSRTRSVLDERLGLEPSASLRSLHERVLRQDESLGAQPELAASSISMSSHRRRTEEATPAPTNLPTVVRPLIGRDAQLDSLTELLGGVRLLTLVGPGGAGKTSLALAIVVRTSGGFPDGAFGVRLASVTASSHVPLAVADALGIPLDGAAADRDVRQRLLTYLSRRRLLLLFDNCEHLIDAAAALIDEILGRCPNVTIVATSREALAVPDEVQVNVGPLDTPPDGTSAADVLNYPACQLFVERFRAVRPGTVFDHDDLAATAAISRSLDGIPLALELAASRGMTMSPTEISERLGERFSLLTSGARTAEARQQTLRAAVDWSYALLVEHERRIFDRLSVFHGGWTLSAAEAVIGDDTMPAGDVVGAIGRLAQRSMIVVERGTPTRYRMLETLRQYAAERLAGTGEEPAVRRRHAEYFRDHAEHADAALRGQGQRQTLLRLRQEQPNIKAALTWFEGEGDDLDSALLTAGSLGLFWHLGRHLEGRETLARLLSGGAGSPAPRARALQAVSLVDRPRACLVHPSPRCAAAARESLAIFDHIGDESRAALSRVLVAVEGVTGEGRAECERLLTDAEGRFRRDGDQWGEAVIGFVRMETALKDGDQQSSVAIGRATVAKFRALDDPWGLSAVLYHLGWGLRQFGRYDEGSRILEEAIDVASSAGLYNTVQWALADLGVAQLHLGNETSARDCFDRAVAASEHIGDGAGAVLAGYGYGLLAHRRGDWTEARERYSAARVGFAALGTPVSEGLATVGVARCDEAEERMDDARKGYQEALAAGRVAGEPGLTAAALEGLARFAMNQRRAAEAAELVKEAASVRSRFSRPAAPMERVQATE